MFRQYLDCFQMLNKSFHLLELLRFYKVNNLNFIRNASTGKKLLKMNKYDMESAYKVSNNKKSSRITQPDDYFYVCDPVSAGPGVVSKALLKAGVPRLRILEKNEDFLLELKELSKQHSNLEIIEEDFLFLPFIEHRSFDDDSISYLEAFFKDVPNLSWNEGAPFRIFSIISSKKSLTFLRFLLAVLPNRSSIFFYGRCELFLLLPHSEYLYLIAEHKKNFSIYRWSTVLYRLFFEITILDKKEENDFYLVKFIPRSDLFSSRVNDNKLKDFYFFIRYHLVRRTWLVIPTLEGWVPSCGPRLIKEGMRVFTRFGDLSPEQLLMLFNQFSSWPEYEQSPFHRSLRKFYRKESLPYDDDENSRTKLF
ncbi:unnamed protein product [Larinioides sclopetarius]|uniref:rRNA adenine N(6)-methyltransferase n=1 Tax=Larinioides sclopetarius TaxID=280406 RepID=A0AAV2BWR1_9ARAC